MSAVLRPYKDLLPQKGDRVMIDASSVVIGDVRMADDVSIWPLVAIRGGCKPCGHWCTHQYSGR
ncbi:protein YrdA [Enterobacter ludwigii]|nr:protein YrdA [Enterobacter ludwigii]